MYSKFPALYSPFGFYLSGILFQTIIERASNKSIIPVSVLYGFSRSLIVDRCFTANSSRIVTRVSITDLVFKSILILNKDFF
jgi:hypothetical protein